MKLRILGSGTSSGVPRIGNDWGACDPTNPRNRRLRASILIESATTRILVDTGPDMREQLLAAGVDTLDAVIWTHDHADHTHGIDDLRQVFHAMGRPVRGLARPDLKAMLERRFSYVFRGHDGYPPTVVIEALPDTITIGDITVSTVEQPHGPFVSAGLRFDNAAGSIGYATDFSAMTPDMATLYQGLDLWVVDALRRRPHPSHADLPSVLGWVEAFRPGHTVLTHMDQSMDYATLVAELPPGVEPGYDGLERAL
ncbi:MBL fold metallo-hydrolase [Sphingomonas sp. 10B4]|uniref:MBL fold metallo-hydrolase n=1 Tax=Sphingomonas sp. 10B4 TaxID=3048575 RepID=UPI002AB337C9|nr:MBL fold metallo-hydrolase [Sphingomonas sp. 10B4]MDY7525873.1 MBL fold metallo-hydrolase [Sphingomonas sp. 10B4]MEB0283382.1 MBL fold metallo-hydrolase [Sphingomonas sp. 10B4]